MKLSSYYKTAFCLICIYLCVPFLTNAQNISKAIFDSSNKLTTAKEYNQSVLLLERALYDYRTDSMAVKVALLLCKNHIAQKQFAAASRTMEENRNLAMQGNIKYNYYLQWCLAYLLNEKFEECLLKTQEVISEFPDSSTTPDILFLKILAYNGKADWVSAKPLYNSLVQLYAAPADTGFLLQQYGKLPKLKSAKKAEKLSAFLPLTGAGLFYAGKPAEACLNIVLQAGFLYFGIHQFLEKEYISGALVGVGMYASFYNGGSRRAVHLVEEYNKQTIGTFNRDVAMRITQIMQLRN